MRTHFDKVMSDPVPIPEAGIERAVAVLRSNRPFRYGEDTGTPSEASLLEAEVAAWSGRAYAAAVNSCGCSLFLALKALGVAPGDRVLCNAFTLAPVPGAIVHAAARPVMVDVTERLTIDLADLEAKLASSGARVLLLSQMRGHLPDMHAVMRLCDAAGVSVIEDCAHTLGARYDGQLAGTFGAVGCYSAQTFKHVNAGEGGLIVTDDADVAARAIIMSGSYMMYAQNGARPSLEAFERWRDETPNFSMRMTDTAAALVRPQLAELPGWAARWNAAHDRIEAGLSCLPDVRTIRPEPLAEPVRSSLQFLIDRPPAAIEAFVRRAAAHGVFLKWFGAERTTGFTSRYDQWNYAKDDAPLADAPLADAPLRSAPLRSAPGILARLIDMRIALSFDEGDCDTIVAVITEALEAAGQA